MKEFSRFPREERNLRGQRLEREAGRRGEAKKKMRDEETIRQGG